MARLTVSKTYKLFIGGGFPRTESGRSLPVESSAGEILAHICRGSRKDIRDAVEAAAKAQSGWAQRTAYNRAQILYRMAEMLEGKREEFAEIIKSGSPRKRTIADTRKEVDASIDRLIAFAGWADKFAQVLGCNNPVAGPYYNFTIPEPVGVVAIVAPDDPPLLGLVSLIAAALCAGNTVVALASETQPIPAMILAEVCATSDVPGGVINILTGLRDELVEHFASHRNVNAISAANLGDDHRATLRRGAAENLKRVVVADVDDFFDDDTLTSPWQIEPLVDMKTIWHPSAV